MGMLSLPSLDGWAGTVMVAPGQFSATSSHS